VPVPIDGVLDLHTFRPQDIKEVVLEYLAACRAQGVLEVRIIHGRGIGNLQRTVHALLGRIRKSSPMHWPASFTAAPAPRSCDCGKLRADTSRVGRAPLAFDCWRCFELN